MTPDLVRFHPSQPTEARFDSCLNCVINFVMYLVLCIVFFVSYMNVGIFL